MCYILRQLKIIQSLFTHIYKRNITMVKETVLDEVLIHWGKKLSGVDGMYIADKTGYSHQKTLDVFDELVKEQKGTVKKDQKLCQLKVVLDENNPHRIERSEIATSIFLPSRRILEDWYYASELSRQRIPEYAKRRYLGCSEIEPIYFETSVLQRYLGRPDIYSVSDTISGVSINTDREAYQDLKDNGSSKEGPINVDFGKRRLSNGQRVIVAILYDLANLPKAHQSLWYSCEIIDPPIFITEDNEFDDFISRAFRAEDIESHDPFHDLLVCVREINTLFKDKMFFRNEYNPDLSYPVINTCKALCDSCSELYKILGQDSLVINTLKYICREYLNYTKEDFIQKKGARNLSPLQLLELITSRIKDGHDIVPTVRKLQNYRLEADHRIDPQGSTDDFINQFEELCEDLLRNMVVLKHGLKVIIDAQKKP